MSPIGRIFVVINLVLSAGFLGWASAVLAKSEEFKGKFDTEVQTHGETRRSKDERIALLNAKVDETVASLEQVRGERGRFEQDSKRFERSFEEERGNNSQLRSAVEGIQAKLDNFNQTMQGLQGRVAELEKEKERLRDEREKAVNAQMLAETERANAEETLRRANDSIASLETTVTQVSEERDRLKMQRDTLVAMTGVSLDKVQAQPYIQASVLEVLADPGLVALSVGADDGVEPGYSFDVFRGSNYKGKVTVDTVDRKLSTARITLRAPGANFEKGDRAATRLP